MSFNNFYELKLLKKKKEIVRMYVCESYQISLANILTGVFI